MIQSPLELSAYPAQRAPRHLRVLLVLLAVALVALIGCAALISQRVGDGTQGLSLELPPTPPPAVEPFELKQVEATTARDINAKVPFAGGPNPPARPFELAGSATDIARATDCLASAIYYEAAAETENGQRAVAQVVLNRVRHPAFPHTVCGVVYQGSTRRTGCQFSFSCDGSMARVPSGALWSRIRGIASSMLSGSVYAPVGLATHYHTDWVVPYWSAKLDKITNERTHLFFKWAGWWGSPKAFRIAYDGNEPLVSSLARLSPIHAQALAGEVALDAGAAMPVSTSSLEQTFASPAGNFLIFVISPRSDPAMLAEQAKLACGGQPYCKVMMWTDRAATPASLPVNDAQLERMAFSYLRNEKGSFEKALWNCAVFKRSDPDQCMRARNPLAAPPAVAPSGAAPPAQRSRASAQSNEELIPVDPQSELRPGPDAEPTERRVDPPPTPNTLIRRRPGQ